MYKKEASYGSKLLLMLANACCIGVRGYIHQAAHNVYRSHNKVSGSKAGPKTPATSLKMQQLRITK